MAKLKFELFITNGDEQLTIVADDKPILFGCGPNCDVNVGDGEPKIKAMIQKEGAHLTVKVFDLKYPVNINGKKYKSAKIKKSAFFKIGLIDIISNVEEVLDGPPSSPEQKTSSKVLPAFVDHDVTRTSISHFSLDELKAQTKSNVIPDIQTKINTDKAGSVAPGTYSQDGFLFNISFDKEDAQLMLNQTYANTQWDYSGYIDSKDESVKSLPVAEIHRVSKDKSFHVTHMNNGTVISDHFYPVGKKRIFMSNTHSRNNYVQIHDCAGKKLEFIYTRDGQPYVNSVNGYKLYLAAKGILHEIQESSNQIIEDQKIILSKDTSQIIIEITPTPGTIKTNRFLNIQEEMLKSIALAWLPLLLFVGTLVLYPPEPDNEKIKEKVVILKRQKTKKEIKKPEPIKKAVLKPEAAPAPKVVDNKKSTPPPPPKKEMSAQKTPVAKTKVVKKIAPVKKPQPKQAASKKAAPKRVTKAKKVALAKRAAPRPTPKKQYKFSFGKKLESKVNSVSKSTLKVAQSQSNINVATAVSSSTSISDSLTSSKSFGKTDTKVARFAAGGKSGASKRIGAKGLSGKSRSATAYIQANTKILGAIDPGLIRKLMREFIPEFRRCYQRELLKNSKVAGVFDLAFKINAKGKGVKVKVKSHGKGFSGKGRKCIRRVVSLIKFPKPKGGGQVDVKQPMNFYNQ